MQALGAEVIRTPDDEGMAGAIKRAQELAAKIPGAFMAGQFENRANPDYHYETTGREIWDQMQGNVDAVVLGAGTGGTFTGVARYIKERNPKAKAYLVESQGSIYGGGEPGDHKVEGIGSSFIPKTADVDLADRVITVFDWPAFDMVRRLAREEGVFSGSSGGAAVHGAVQVAKELGAGKKVVTVIPDSAERYLSKNIFEGP
jgi:cysteine synthase A